MSAPRHGLTLIELLIVVAIIGVLMSIGVPVIGAIRSGAYQMTCNNHLRQIGMAALGYARDYEDYLPAEGNDGITDPDRSPAWFYRLPPYLDQVDVRGDYTVFQCPVFHWSGPQHFDHASPKSFKMNSRLDNGGRHPHYQLGDVHDESELVLFFDAEGGETGRGQHGAGGPGSVDPLRHRGSINVLFCDGHARASIEEPADGDWSRAVRWESRDW